MTMKKLLLLTGLLLASPAFAADNTVIVTPGTGVTMRSKDVGLGVESMINIVGDASGNPVYGTAGTANANILTVQGIASMTPLLATVTGAVIAQGTGAAGAAVAGNPFRVGLSDGTNSQNWLAAIALADGVNGNNTGAVAAWLWNGATYDRQRGDLTNGAFVNVKTSVLPTGAATAAGVATVNTTLGTPMQQTGGSVTANAGTNLNTSALATSANQATNGATTAHTCSTGGFSELGCLGQIDDDVKGPIAAGTNTIGNVGSDPSSGKATPTEAFLALPATTTTQIVALSGTKVTYVTLAKVLAGGTVNVTFKYGTGSNCGTGTTTLEGPWPLTTQTGWVEGNGAGPVMIVPSAQALCITTDASVGGGVKLIYQQF